MTSSIQVIRTAKHEERKERKAKSIMRRYKVGSTRSRVRQSAQGTDERSDRAECTKRRREDVNRKGEGEGRGEGDINKSTHMHRATARRAGVRGLSRWRPRAGRTVHVARPHLDENLKHKEFVLHGRNDYSFATCRRPQSIPYKLTDVVTEDEPSARAARRHNRNLPRPAGYACSPGCATPPHAAARGHHRHPPRSLPCSPAS